MRILDAVVEPFVRTVLDTRHELSLCSGVRAQLVCHHHAWRDALAFQQFAHQPESGSLVSTALQQGIENVTVGIDGAPQPVFLSLYGHDHLIKMPFVSKIAAGPPTKLKGELQAKFPRPFGDSLKRHLDPTLGKQVFNVAQAQRKPIIEPYRMRDDLGWKAVAFILGGSIFSHADRLCPDPHQPVKATPPFARVVIPASTPFILVGFRIGLGSAWATVVAAELIAAQSGLGFRMQQAQLYYDLATIFVSLIAIGILGLIMDRIVVRAEQRLTHWQERVHHD